VARTSRDAGTPRTYVVIEVVDGMSNFSTVLPGDGADALFLTVEVQCKSRPGVNIESCKRCRQNHRATRCRVVNDTSTPPVAGDEKESWGDEEEFPGIVVFSRAQKRRLQICNGRVVVFPRLTCYSSHHPDSNGFV